MKLARRELLGAGALLPVGLSTSLLAGGNRMPAINIVELRQYTLHGGRRDELIDLFEREFVKTQEVVGAHVLGTFRDLDDPDRFVWLRGFESMAVRADALAAFYSGPTWHAHREAANATMLDSDNVLLLRRMGGRIDTTGAAVRAPGVVTAHIHYLGRTEPALFAELFERRLRPLLANSGAEPFGTLATEPAPNNFPRLPVREGERVFVWFVRHPDESAADRLDTRLARLSGWRDGVPEAVIPALMRKPERLRLAPTARSPMR